MLGIGGGGKSIGTLVAYIGANIDGLEAGLKHAENRMKQAGQRLSSIGSGLTMGITAPLAAVGGAALKMAVDFNKGMAEVATLIPGNTERVNELKNAVKEMAVDIGKSTSDLTAGLYQTISAFGDSADAVKILEISAKAAVAGVSTTKDALNLVAAVTKAYGDTSAEAAQHAADLAFQTVKLGQTTFPELAGAIGRTTPMANALGVSVEELFAGFATLTGVTGDTNEVATQLRSTFQSLLNPTDEMARAMDRVASKLEAQGKLVDNELTRAWRRAKSEYELIGKRLDALQKQLANTNETTKEGKEKAKALRKEIKQLEKVYKEQEKAVIKAAGALGRTIVEAEGVQGAILDLNEQAEGNTRVMGRMWGNVRALNAVLALAGSQSDTYRTKLDSMKNVQGASTEAFKEQTEGVNTLGAKLDQLKAKLSVMAITFGEVLIPAVLDAVEAIEPLLQYVLDGIRWFGELDPEVRKTVIQISALAAAIGPAVVAGGKLIQWASSVPGALAMLSNPIGLTVAAIAAIGTAIYQVWKHWDEIWPKFEKAWDDFVSQWDQVSEAVVEAFSVIYRGAQEWLVDKWEEITQSWNQVSEAVAEAWSIASRAVVEFAQDLYEGVYEWIVRKFTSIVDGIKEKIDSIVGFFRGMYEAVVGHSYVPDMIEEIGSAFAQLDELMVAPARISAQDVASSFSGLAREVGFQGQVIIQKVRDIGLTMAGMNDEISEFVSYQTSLAGMNEELATAADLMSVFYNPTQSGGLAGMNEELQAGYEDRSGFADTTGPGSFGEGFLSSFGGQKYITDEGKFDVNAFYQDLGLATGQGIQSGNFEQTESVAYQAIGMSAASYLNKPELGPVFAAILEKMGPLDFAVDITEGSYKWAKERLSIVQKYTEGLIKTAEEKGVDWIVDRVNDVGKITGELWDTITDYGKDLWKGAKDLWNWGKKRLGFRVAAPDYTGADWSGGTRGYSTSASGGAGVVSITFGDVYVSSEQDIDLLLDRMMDKLYEAGVI